MSSTYRRASLRPEREKHKNHVPSIFTVKRYFLEGPREGVATRRDLFSDRSQSWL